MPILTDEQDSSVGRNRDEHNRAFVAHDLEIGLTTVRQADPIHGDVEMRPV